MKALLVSILMALTSTSALAASNYCQATELTLQEVERLREVELPYAIVFPQMSETLQADSCVQSKLSDEEIEILTELLLADDYRQDTAEQIIGEFIAL